ncbi:AAA family ATPase [Paenibacillus sp. 2TAB19]|uniref:AAA family ATPase n=1 Tax=Paenibacillus sp. 2TAB19 TaxID=3233003 RepID=UPI003F9C9589
MRLVEAEIDGFGQLHDAKVDLDAPVTILYGPNEAGKSTVFGFIRTMLYGFANRGSAQAPERQEPVNGGRHGGRLFWRDGMGSSYVIQRYATDGSGKLSLRELNAEAGSNSGLAEGVQLLQAELERRYLGGIGDRMYRQLFAVTLSELQQVGALSGEELGQYLYQAGWDNGKSIAAAEKKLRDEMEELFKPKGSTKSMNKQLKELEQIEAALRKHEDSIDAYNSLVHQSERLEEEIAERDRALPQLASKQQLLAKACSSRAGWLQKQQLLMERERFDYAARINTESERSWRELSRLRTERLSELERYKQQMYITEKQLEAIEFDQALIDTADETEAMVQSAEGYRLLKLELAELRAELQSHDEAIGGLLGSIAPEWTERQLRELRVTVADRDYIRGLRQQEEERMRGEERVAAEQEALKRQEREVESALGEAEAALERAAADGEQAAGGFALLPRTREALRGAWNALDLAFREWELERTRLAAAAEADGIDPSALRGAAAGRGGAGPVWAGAAGAGGAAVALGIVAAGSGAEGGSGFGWIAAIVLAIVALVLMVLAFGRSQKPNDRRSRSGGRSAGSSGRYPNDSFLRDREQQLVTALAAVVREPEHAAAALLSSASQAEGRSAEQTLAAERLRSGLHAAVEARLEKLQATERLESNKGEQERKLARLREQLNERSKAAASAALSKQAAVAEWRGWLEVRALPPHMSQTAALEAIELAEQAMQRLRQYDKLTAKQAAVTQQLAAFEAQAAKLCAAFADAAGQLPADPALGLRLLQAETRRHAAAKEQALRARQQQEELLHNIARIESSLAELRPLMQALLHEADLPSEAAYEEALLHLSTLADLELALNKLQLELTAGLSEQRLAELEELLYSYDEEQLRALHDEAVHELAQLESQQKDQLEQKGRLRQSIDQLLQTKERQRLVADREQLLAQLDGDAERYAMLAVSAALISRTKRIYEEERQPVVLRHASSLIETLTDGKYIRVLSHPGATGIRLETADRRIIDSNLLSRGTAELVYLAMRFALAEEASHNVKLPLLLDDVFVNFDKDRLRAAAKLIAELSQQRQVIVMTCHEHVRDALLEYGSETSLVELSSVAN